MLTTCVRQCTATADSGMRGFTSAELGLNDPDWSMSAPYRPNLFHNVQLAPGVNDKCKCVVSRVKKLWPRMRREDKRMRKRQMVTFCNTMPNVVWFTKTLQ